ncbi:UDP-glucose 6-dehydrogenase [Musa troglodytarum]|uniref:UDP-glucose 6-dehydrogenase n=1 Tax=Musa troglodytarum TaxID=320322 RepID=A0A9E7ER81_9LILI|nr:UDP-glucose 6-dehydrogenase [Musa troglodytarum]
MQWSVSGVQLLEAGHPDERLPEEPLREPGGVLHVQHGVGQEDCRARVCFQEGHRGETPAIDVCKGLLRDNATISIYDPQVTEDHIQRDLATNKFDWDHQVHLQPMSPTAVKQVSIAWDAYEAAKGTHGLCILTDWDEFKELDYQRIYDDMQKPAFVFDGRNVVDPEKLRPESIGKPLDSWLKYLPAAA